jgi:translation initiation factor IF-3
VRIRGNGELRGTPNVRVFGASGEPLGVMTLAEALKLARKEGLDLVEIVPNANPPVCKLLDLSKYQRPRDV